MATIAEGASLDQQRLKSGLSLLFAPGSRPAAAQIDEALGSAGAGLPGAIVSHRAPAAEGWVELLASGLTYELHGLAPAAATPLTAPAHRFGFAADASRDLEAVALVPGPHIAGGAAMMPIVRTIAGLAANLALALPVQVVCWEPADSWMEARYFARAVIAWLAGGPFPALGLTAIRQRADGFVTSAGLTFFADQEVCVAARVGEAPPDTAKLAIRVIDNIVRSGPITTRTELDAPSGGLLIAEPSVDGRVVMVWRAS